MKEYTVKVFDDRTEWYMNGKRHREDGPAIEHVNGTKYWILYSKRHREDGPAVECPEGVKKWYLNDKLHRTDGPAIEYADGGTEWWIDGIEYDEDEFKVMVKPIIENEHKEKYLSYKQSLTAEEMLDEELIKCELGTLKSFQSPYDALQELINFHIDLERYMSKQKN